MRLELYLLVAGVTMSQDVAVETAYIFREVRTGVTYMYTLAGCLIE